VSRLSGFVRRYNTGSWVALLLGLLVVLNALGVWVYARAHPKQNGWQCLWNYLESDTAKLVSASLIFPLLIFVIEGRFKLLETFRAARSERRRRAQDERRASRALAIDQTVQFWSQVTDWVGDVMFCDSSDLDTLAKLKKRSWALSVAGADAINGWARFHNTVDWSGPGDATKLQQHFLTLVNVLISCTDSTLGYLRAAGTDDDRASLQASLQLIGSGLKQAVQHPVRNVLYASLELMDIVESEDPEELRFISSDAEAKERQADLQKTIDDNVTALAAWSNLVGEHRSEVLATATSEAADAVRTNLSDVNGLRDRYLAIPRDERLHAWEIAYTREWLDSLADEFAFQLFISEGVGRNRPSAMAGQ
jgi:hypothetical protein